MKWQITYDNDDINQIIDYCVDNFQYYFDKIEHEFTPSDKIDDVIHNYSTNIAHDCFKSLVQDCIQNSLSQFSKQEKDFLETIHSWNDYELSKESDLNPNNFDRYAKQKCYELEKITDYSAYLKDEFNQKDQNINTRRYK